jgi:hypothetical protein
MSKSKRKGAKACHCCDFEQHFRIRKLTKGSGGGMADTYV